MGGGWDEMVVAQKRWDKRNSGSRISIHLFARRLAMTKAGKSTDRSHMYQHESHDSRQQTSGRREYKVANSKPT